MFKVFHATGLTHRSNCPSVNGGQPKVIVVSARNCRAIRTFPLSPLTRQDKSFSVQPIASKAALCKTPVCICLRQPNCGHIRSKRRSQTAVTVVLPGGGGARLCRSPAAALTLFPWQFVLQGAAAGLCHSRAPFISAAFSYSWGTALRPTQAAMHNQFDGVNKTCIFTPLIFNYE
jgi:hypothetical protein